MKDEVLMMLRVIFNNPSGSYQNILPREETRSPEKNPPSLVNYGQNTDIILIKWSSARLPFGYQRIGIEASSANLMISSTFKRKRLSELQDVTLKLEVESCDCLDANRLGQAPC